MSGMMNTESDGTLSMEMFNITNEHFEHLITLLEAYYIYEAKDAVRGDLWRQFPPSDKIRELRERVMRIDAAYQAGVYDPIIEDATDMMNFCAFLIRQIKEGASG